MGTSHNHGFEENTHKAASSELSIADSSVVELCLTTSSSSSFNLIKLSYVD